MQVVKTLWLQVYSRCELTVTQDKPTCQSINRFLVLGCVLCVFVCQCSMITLKQDFCFLADSEYFLDGHYWLVIYGKISYD